MHYGIFIFVTESTKTGLIAYRHGRLSPRLRKRGVALTLRNFNFNASSIKSSGGFLKFQRGFDPNPRNPSRSTTDNEVHN